MSFRRSLQSFAPFLLAAAIACTGEENEEGALDASQELAPIYATSPSPLDATSSIEATAASYASGQIANLGPLHGWQQVSSKVGAGGLRHVRLAQQHGGIPVIGGDVIVHLDDAQVLSMSGNVVAGLADLNLNPRLEARAMLEAAKHTYLAKVTRKTDALVYDREKTALAILPGDGKRSARLVWHVEFHTEQQGGVEPGLWNSFYDAQTGELLHAFNGIRYAQASGPGGNAKIARSWSNALDSIQISPTIFRLDTSDLVTRKLNGGTSGAGSPVSGALSNIGDAETNDAHGFAEITQDMLSAWQGYYSIDGQGIQIQNRVHYGVNFANAFWDGLYMTFGDGDASFYPFTGDIGTVAHEIHHGFTQYHAGLNYMNEAGAVEESFSDIGGEVTEAYFLGTAPNFLVSSDITVVAVADRYMCTPTADGVSIDHYSNYNSANGHHRNGGIMNKAFCRAAKRFGSGSAAGAATQASVLRASRAWYEANDNFWMPGTNFAQACQGVYDAAGALGFTPVEREMLRLSWADVGVACGSPLKQHELFRDSSNHIREIHNNGSAWTANLDLTTLASTVVAAGDSFGYSVGAQQLVVFRDSSGNLHELSNSGGTWSDTNLTTLTSGTTAASEPTAYAVGSQKHVVFRGTDGNLHELYYGGSFWVDNNLTTFISGSTPPAGKPFGYTMGNQQHIVFRASNGDVHELYNNGSFWVDNNLTAVTTGVKSASDPMGYVMGSTQHVIFRGTDGNLHEYYNNGSFWVDNNLNAFVSGGTQPTGAPFGFATPATQHVVFKGTDGNLHEYYNNGSFWVDNNLTTFISGSTPPASDPTGYFNGTQHIVFRGTDNHVHELYNGGSFWVDNDLSAIVGGPNPVAGVFGSSSP